MKACEHAVNLDALALSELRALLESSELVHVNQRRYARARIAAHEQRLRGRVSAALEAEREADAYYARLPLELRW